MSKYCKLLIVFGLLLVGGKGFSTNTVLHTTTCSISIKTSSIDKQANEGFPSHGYAMLILRFNETNKEVIVFHCDAKPVLKLESCLIINHIVGYTGYSLSFPSKPLNYEVFLYSLPLRSPPAFC